jgi:hypothetical protein
VRHRLTDVEQAAVAARAENGGVGKAGRFGGVGTDGDAGLVGDAGLELRVRPQKHRTRMTTAPRRSVALAALGTAGALVSATVLWFGVQRLVDARGGTAAGDRVVYDKVLPDTPAGLLFVVDDRRGLVNAVVLAGRDDRGGGAVLVIDPDTVLSGTVLSGTAAAPRLGELFDAAAPAPASQGIESLLAVSFDDVQVGDAVALRTLLSPLAPRTVSLATAVSVSDATGAHRFASGARQLDAAQMATLLTGRVKDSTTSANTALDNARGALWVALGSATAGPGTAATTAAATSTRGTAGSTAPAPGVSIVWLMGALSRGPISAVAVPQGGKAGPDAVEIRVLVARVLPGRVSVVSDAPRVRLVASAASPESVTAAVRKLLATGAATVVMVNETTNAAPFRTVIRYRDPGLATSAEQLRSTVFQSAVVEEAGDRIDGIDLTITVGADIDTDVDTTIDTARDSARGTATTKGNE